MVVTGVHPRSHPSGDQRLSESLESQLLQDRGQVWSVGHRPPPSTLMGFFLVGVGWGWGNVFIQALYLHASSALRLGK